LAAEETDLYLGLIASQTALLIEFAREHDLEVPKEWVFEDDGYCGTMLERRDLSA